ncbi:MAG: hypothetical protein HRU17_05205 [Polyangiaceae bacterium]|nr:hypothetical protein [Polyangiaceae bacterium]
MLSTFGKTGTVLIRSVSVCAVDLELSCNGSLSLASTRHCDFAGGLHSGGGFTGSYSASTLIAGAATGVPLC